MTERISALSLFLALGAASPAAAQEGTETTTTESGSGEAGTSSEGGSGDGWGSSGTTEGFVAPAVPGTSTAAGLLAHPFYLGAGLGFDAPFNGRGAVFAIGEEVGYRFFGFNIGGQLDGAIFAGLALGQAFADNFVELQFDVRGGADFEIFDDGSIQILATPSITLGGGLTIVNNVPIVTGGTTTFTSGFFDLGFHAQGELVVADGMIGIWLRPLSFELFLADGSFAQYELLVGVNVRL